MVRWSKSGSITSESRLQLPFLKYINEQEDNWIVCLGVPYGTDLWQVGDSKEQKGSFNISMIKAKMDLLEMKQKKCMNQNHSVTDIIPLINKSWKTRFSRIDKNRKAIAEREWFPLNRNLLTIPEIRATMTANERQIEVDSSSIILPNTKVPLVKKASFDSVTYKSIPTQKYSITGDSTINTSTSLSTIVTKQESLIFNSGTASFVLDAIVQHEDLQKARERIKQEQEDVKSVSDKLKKSAKITVGIMWKCGTNHLGKNILDIMKQGQIKKYQAEKEKIEKAEKAYLKLKDESEALIVTGKPIESSV